MTDAPLGRNSVEVVWSDLIGDRYIIEVIRVKPYFGFLKIFDIEEDLNKIFEEAVSIEADGIFGTYINDIVAWENRSLDWLSKKGKI